MTINNRLKKELEEIKERMKENYFSLGYIEFYYEDDIILIEATENEEHFYSFIIDIKNINDEMILQRCVGKAIVLSEMIGNFFYQELNESITNRLMNYVFKEFDDIDNCLYEIGNDDINCSLIPYEECEDINIYLNNLKDIL